MNGWTNTVNGRAMDGVWLTYQQAGERLGISAEAARQRALRGHWPRRRSNDGVAVVQVPEGVAVRTNARRTPEHTGVEHPDEHTDASVRIRMAELEAQVLLLREMVTDLRDDRDRWRGVAEQLAGRRQATSSAVSAAIAGLRAAVAAKAG